MKGIPGQFWWREVETGIPQGTTFARLMPLTHLEIGLHATAGHIWCELLEATFSAISK